MAADRRTVGQICLEKWNERERIKILSLLNQRFEEYLQEPGQAGPLDVCLARLAERNRQLK